VSREPEQQLVTRDQQVGLTTGRQYQELLVILVAATRQRVAFFAIGLTKRDELAVLLQHLALLFRCQIEFGVIANPFQFGKTFRVRKTRKSFIGDDGSQENGVTVGKVQQVHHDVGIKYKAH